MNSLANSGPFIGSAIASKMRRENARAARLDARRWGPWSGCTPGTPRLAEEWPGAASHRFMGCLARHGMAQLPYLVVARGRDDRRRAEHRLRRSNPTGRRFEDLRQTPGHQPEELIFATPTGRGVNGGDKPGGLGALSRVELSPASRRSPRRLAFMPKESSRGGVDRVAVTLLGARLPQQFWSRADRGCIRR